MLFFEILGFPHSALCWLKFHLLPMAIPSHLQAPPPSPAGLGGYPVSVLAPLFHESLCISKAASLFGETWQMTTVIKKFQIRALRRWALLQNHPLCSEVMAMRNGCWPGLVRKGCGLWDNLQASYWAPGGTCLLHRRNLPTRPKTWDSSEAFWICCSSQPELSSPVVSRYISCLPDSLSTPLF